MNDAIQFSLPEFTPRALRRVRKRVRPASKQQYAVLRDTPGLLTQRQAAVLRSIAAYRNRWQIWPTRAELARWMFEHKDLPRPDHALIAPRLTELSRGTMNRVTREYRGGGVIEPLPKRPCSVAQTDAHPWRVIEAGAAPLFQTLEDAR